jgi:hypothetical protein
MEITVPLDIAMKWIGTAYSSNCSIYQFEFVDQFIQITLHEDHANVIATKNYSVEALTECVDYFTLIGNY